MPDDHQHVSRPPGPRPDRRPEALDPDLAALLTGVDDALASGTVLFDDQLVVRFISPRACRLLEVTEDAVLGRPGTACAWAPVRVDGTPLPPDRYAFARAHRSGSPVAEVFAVRRPDGSLRWVSVRTAPLPHRGGPPWVVSVLSDVSEPVAALEERAETEERLLAAFEQAPVAMAQVGLDRRFHRVNAAFCAMLGRPASTVLGRPTRELSAPQDVDVPVPYLRRLLEGSSQQERWEKRYLRGDGSTLRTRVVANAMLDGAGRATGYLCQFEPLAGLDQQSAGRDEVTGLLDRAGLLARIDAAAAGPAEPRWLLAIHLHGIRAANSDHGHQVGDELMRSAVARLVSLAPPQALLARIDGTDLGLTWVGPPAEARRLAEQVEAVLLPPIISVAGPLPLGSGLGLAGGRPGQGAASLLADAQLALAASLDGWPSTLVQFHPGLRRAAQDRVRREQQVRDAIEARRITIHLQPIVEMASRRVCSMEALVRLVGPDGALLMPADFLAVAEQTGLIVPLGDAVLELACAQLAAWRSRGIAGHEVTVKVNVSATQLVRRNAADHVLAALDRHGLPPESLGLELTESVLLDASEATLRQLTELAAHRVALGIDDVGTGWSSLSNISNLPLSFLKVDRSFVSGLTEPGGRRGDLAIVGALIALGRGAGLQVIAEGVETLGQQVRLLSLGGRFAQGYLYDRPLPPDEMALRLQAGRAGASEQPAARLGGPHG